MTEPADQPLLEHRQPEPPKKAGKRPAKPRKAKTAGTKETVSKARKPRASRKTQSESEALRAADPEPVPSAAPPVGSPPLSVYVPASATDHANEEWRPSAGKKSAEVSGVNEVKRSDVARTGDPKGDPARAGSDADMTATTTAPPTSGRQYPVYIPRHVARQMEQEGKQAPLAVSAQEAAELQIPRPEPSPRMEPQQRAERSERAERAETHTNAEIVAEPPLREEEIGQGEGIVEISGKGFGFIRDPKRGFAQNPNDIFVTPETVRRYNLRDGQWIMGETRRGNRGSQLHRLMTINGEDPEVARNFPAFDELTVISPLERITLETVPERCTTRIIDLMAPIGKGQRGLIVAPPRTGKTTLLQHMADAVVKNHPELKLIILLVDERPEEVTDFKRTVPAAEIMASSNDMDVKSHTRIAQLAIERAKRLVEAGKDVFILLDSITRVGRAFNNAATGGRTMSGGLDSRALEIPRKIFAAARNTEEAGSLTIMATALIETNSRMDDVIFQEFKGTGNMELVLDRKISDQRIYPAVDIFLSGTRREELLVPADDLHKIHVIRRGLAGYKPLEAMERMLFFAKKFPTNAQMLREIPG